MRRAWQGILELQQALNTAPIDTVVVQYQLDMFEVSALAELVSQQQKLNRSVFVIFNSTDGQTALTAEIGGLEIKRALKSCDGIFVHTLSDVKMLNAFNIRRNVSVLPTTAIASPKEQSASDYCDALIADYFLRKLAIAVACADQ